MSDKKQPETPEFIPQRVDKGYTNKAHREGKKIVKPDGCEFLPAGTCIMDLPKKERKKYMWLVPDECKSNPMYDMEPEECKTDICKMKREEKEEETRREKKDKKDRDEKIQQQATTIQSQTNTISTLQTQVSTMQADLQSLHAALSQVISQLNSGKSMQK